MKTSVSISVNHDPKREVIARAGDHDSAYIAVSSGPPGYGDLWLHAHPRAGKTAAEQLLTLATEMRDAIAEVVEREQAHVDAAE